MKWDNCIIFVLLLPLIITSFVIIIDYIKLIISKRNKKIKLCEKKAYMPLAHSKDTDFLENSDGKKRNKNIKLCETTTYMPLPYSKDIDFLENSEGKEHLILKINNNSYIKNHINNLNEIELTKSDIISIGRSDKNSITVYNNSVSREHCIIIYKNNHWIVYNNSTNGTYVNNKNVNKWKVLNKGDLISVSDVELGKIL